MGWVSNVLDAAIAAQDVILQEFPEEKRKLGDGRAAEVIIDGPHGGTFNLWFTAEGGVQYTPDGVPMRNRIWMTEDTFFDLVFPIVTPDTLAELLQKSTEAVILAQLQPRLDVQTALAHGLVRVSGEMYEDKTLYDSGEMGAIFNRVIRKIFFPLAVRMLMKQTKGARK